MYRSGANAKVFVTSEPAERTPQIIIGNRELETRNITEMENFLLKVLITVAEVVSLYGNYLRLTP